MRSPLLSTRKGWISVAAIAIVPLLYSGAYLSAYWNPYGHLNRLPIDVINLDHGVHGENLGKEVVGHLPHGWDIRHTSQAQAVTQLKNGTADLEVVIPADYTRKILDHKTPVITYAVNPGTNYLNTLLMQKETVALTQELNSSLRHVISHDMQKSLASASQSAGQMSAAAGKLGRGVGVLTRNGSSLSEASGSAANGAQALGAGASTLAQGSSQLSSNLTVMAADTGKLTRSVVSAAAQLQSSASALHAASQQSGQLLAQINADLSQIGALMGQGPLTAAQQAEMQGDEQQVHGDQLALQKISRAMETGAAAGGSSGSAASLEQLSASAKTLQAAMSQAAAAGASLAHGSASIGRHAATLTQGLHTLASQQKRYVQGVSELAAPLTTLHADLHTMGSGLKRASPVMTDVDQPVKGTLRQLGPSSNYGKGLSPYFLALSLWVGALVVTVIVPGGKRKGFGLRQGTSFFVGLAQSLILAGGILLLLPLDPVHPWAFWGIMAAIAIAWWAVMRLMAEKLGDGGRLLGIVLLVVQLAGSAGTYPIQLSPKFFGAIHPYLPMTWAIHLLRYAISGAMAPRVGHNLLWLGLVAVTSWAIVQFTPGRIPFNSPPLEAGLDESGPMDSLSGPVPPAPVSS